MRVRARDHDRDQVLEDVQQAYVDGQVDADEFERRNAAALSAIYLDELEPLIDDLQGARPLAPDLATAKKSVLRFRADQRPWWVNLLLGLGIVAVFLAIVVLPRVFYGTPATRSTDFRSAEQKKQDSLEEHAASMRVMWSSVKEELTSRAYSEDTYAPVEDVGAWRVHAETIDAVLAFWEHAFRSPYLRSLELRPSELVAERPFGRTRPRVEEWGFTSGERGLDLRRAAESRGRDLALFDLHDLDVDALLRNIEQGKTSLGVDEAELQWVDIGFHGREEAPIVEIWVGNTYDENGFMRTALDGRVISERPFSAD